MDATIACQIRLGFATILTLSWSMGWAEFPKAAKPIIDQLGKIEQGESGVMVSLVLRTNLKELARLMELMMKEGCGHDSQRMNHVRILCDNVMKALHGV